MLGLRIRGLAVLVLLMVAQAPAASSQTNTTTSSSCPAAVMTYFALPLSSQIKGLPTDVSNSDPAQTASVINQYLPAIDGALNLTLPALQSNDKCVTDLVDPFQNFVTQSNQVDPGQPDTACTFLVATLELAAAVALVATGNEEGIPLVSSMFSEAGNLCGISCQTTIELSVFAFVTQYLPSQLANLKTAICSGGDPIHSICDSPEFPFDATALLLLTGVVVAAYLLTRRITLRRGPATHEKWVSSVSWRRFGRAV